MNESTRRQSTASAGAGAKPAAARARTVHQLKITLLGVKPPIWRRLLVPTRVNLLDLHDIIQVAMGWTDSHLHEFRVTRSAGRQTQIGTIDEHREHATKLGDVIPVVGDRLRYQYDFGDDWEHEILVEAILPRTHDETYPRCIKGKRACPPDDCGGVWGYANMLHALSHADDPEHGMWSEWIRPSFDPEAFDLDAINRQLAAIPLGQSRAMGPGYWVMGDG